MSLTNAPRLLKAALAVASGQSGQITKTIAFQYNPTQVSRSVRARDVAEDAEPSDLLRLSGPPIETISLEALFDATDALERGDAVAIEHGVSPQLAALEQLITPSVDAIVQTDALADRGELELIPPATQVTLLVWSADRILPVRLAELSIEEEHFDSNLNPLRARVSMSVRVLSSDDLQGGVPGRSLFLRHLSNRERLADLLDSSSANTIRLGGIE